MTSRDTVALLERWWSGSGERLGDRCRGLTDDELRWAPVKGAWNLVPDRAHPGGWSYPYDFDPDPPHPVTSIGWRLVHLTGDNEIYVEHAFGPGVRNFPDLPVQGTAGEVLARLAGEPAARQHVARLSRGCRSARTTDEPPGRHPRDLYLRIGAARTNQPVAAAAGVNA